MKYTEYNDDEKVLVNLGRKHTSESELDAQWKEDIGIPTSELDIDSTIEFLKKEKKSMGFYWDSSFIVISNNILYMVTFTIYSIYKMTYSVKDLEDNFSLSLVNEVDIKTPYLITDKDLEAWQKTKQQIIENLGLSSWKGADVNIF